MKSFSIVLIIVFSGLMSCEKAREFVGRFEKKSKPEISTTANPEEIEVRPSVETDNKELPEHAPTTGEAKPETPSPTSKDWLPQGMQRR